MKFESSVALLTRRLSDSLGLLDSLKLAVMSGYSGPYQPVPPQSQPGFHNAGNLPRPAVSNNGPTAPRIAPRILTPHAYVATSQNRAQIRPMHSNMTMSTAPATLIASSPSQRMATPVSVQSVNTVVSQHNSTGSSSAPASMPVDAFKCKKFLENLVKLSSGRGPEVGQRIRQLVQQLVMGQMEPENFDQNLLRIGVSTSKQNAEGLVTMLKKGLPALREHVKKKNAANAAAGISPNSLQQVNRQPPGPRMASPHIQMEGGVSSTTNPSGYSERLPGQQYASIRHPSPAGGPSPNMHNYVRAASNAGSSSAIPARPVLPDSSMRAPSFSSSIPSYVSSSSSSHTSAAHIPQASPSSSSSIREEEDDINDVTALAGVNVHEEASRLTDAGKELHTRVCPESRLPPFVTSCALLQHKVNRHASRLGITEPCSLEVARLISQACQLRLKNLIERFGVAAQHRLENYRQEGRYEIESEVKPQIKFFHQLETAELKRKQEIEKESLLRTAKSRSRLDDPEEKKRACQKVRELEQSKLDQVQHREANITALNAIDNAAKKRRLDNDRFGGGYLNGQQQPINAFGTSVPLYGGSQQQPLGGGLRGAPTGQPSPWRTRVITAKDAVVVLEQDRHLSKSSILYQTQLKL